jgi:hypothetical protein
VFLCVCVHENVVNLKTIEGADYVKSSWLNSSSDTVFADAGNMCCLTSQNDTFYCTYLIMCLLIIMFMWPPFPVIWHTHTYIYIYIYVFTRLIIYTTSYRNKKSITILWCSYYVYCIVCKILSLNVA